jgi:hypothetical protein
MPFRSQRPGLLLDDLGIHDIGETVAGIPSIGAAQKHTVAETASSK